MPLPNILAEDIDGMDAVLAELLARSDASAAFVIDKGGFLIAQAGHAAEFDATTLSALAAGSFAATESMAQLVHEPNFNSVYQQGEHFSLLVLNVDSDCLLVAIFKAQVSVGVVKYYAAASLAGLALLFQKARKRNPEASVDLSVLNLEDTAEFFHRKRTNAV